MENFEVIKFTNESMAIDVNVSPNGETVWLTKEQMSILFDRDRSVISRHIKNIFDEGEIDKGTSVHFLHVTNSYKPVSFYSLDVVISNERILAINEKYVNLIKNVSISVDTF